jgi:hypothetical protein
MEKPRRLNLKILPGGFSIHRFGPHAAVPGGVLGDRFFNICRTEDELSIVCADSLALDSPRCATGWSCIQVAGPLDFSLTGILAHLAGLLAAAGVSVFAMSTFDTDYLLVKTAQLDVARAALEGGGHTVAG